jgi:type IV secretory pathway component VirB8
MNMSPWAAQPLTEAAKKPKFRKVMDLQAERFIYGRQAIVAGWTLSGVGILTLGASAFGWIVVMNRPIPLPRFIEVERNTGVLSQPVGVENAPKLFGAATEQHFLRTYILAREAWTPERDRENDHTVRIMSSPAEQARLNEERVKRVVDKNSYITLENFQWVPGVTDPVTHTHKYTVRYLRTVWHKTESAGATASPSKEPWTAVIEFQWHPEYKMNDEDRDINLGGFVETNYNAQPDRPDTQRK